MAGEECSWRSGGKTDGMETIVGSWRRKEEEEEEKEEEEEEEEETAVSALAAEALLRAHVARVHRQCAAHLALAKDRFCDS